MPMIMRDLPQTKKPETAEFRFKELRRQFHRARRRRLPGLDRRAKPQSIASIPRMMATRERWSASSAANLVFSTAYRSIASRASTVARSSGDDSEPARPGVRPPRAEAASPKPDSWIPPESPYRTNIEHNPDFGKQNAVFCQTEFYPARSPRRFAPGCGHSCRPSRKLRQFRVVRTAAAWLASPIDAWQVGE